ncbi:sigma 54-interacting transcriptional regulator [Candidatus Poribacteria bacterium]|jgi:two-component system, NtrC family, response regulator HydG|nr:sigma 54-interacting transcriptional regulator [Candidatus Poribacteria bacterium]MBT5711151.1 sigma 54-interacting transcriptional regulator [Candidatus Poribacteria bacterium]
MHIGDERFRMLVENSASDIALIAADGRVIDAAPSTEGRGALGLETAEFVGRSIFELIHPEDADDIRGVLADLAANPGATVSARFRCRDVDGAWRHLEAAAVSCLDEPDVSAIVVNFHDATDRVTVEAQRDILLSALSDVDVGIVVLDGERILRPNDAFCRMTGYSEEALAALDSALDIIARDEREPMAEELARHLAGQVARNRYDATILRADGSRMLADIAIKTVRREERSEIIAVVQDVTERRQAEDARREAIAGLRTRVSDLARDARSRYAFENIAGRSPAMRRVFAQIELAASEGSDRLPVLITGETGTGKELVAKATHYHGPRRDGPFVPVNCASIPEALVESELFGHEKGAFTGATGRRIGRFEQANGGSVLLDEVGDMPAQTQAKLLRVLQEREIQRVGGTEMIPIDVRVIAATNRDLAAAVDAGEFRADLYYRIAGLRIPAPPLRDRLQDLAPLADHILRAHAEQLGRPPLVVSPEAMGLLASHPWPGNVRELETALYLAAELAARDGEDIQPRHLAIIPGAERPTSMDGEAEGLSGMVDAFRRRVIEETLRACDGNRSEAARRLAMDRSNLRALMKRLGVD